jgi:hypothetical protein
MAEAGKGNVTRRVFYRGYLPTEGPVVGRHGSAYPGSENGKQLAQSDYAGWVGALE